MSADGYVVYPQDSVRFRCLMVASIHADEPRDLLIMWQWSIGQIVGTPVPPMLALIVRRAAEGALLAARHPQ
jgi:hypothetical protein